MQIYYYSTTAGISPVPPKKNATFGDCDTFGWTVLNANIHICCTSRSVRWLGEISHPELRRTAQNQAKVCLSLERGQKQRRVLFCTQ
jgi:hypothetical protein